MTVPKTTEALYDQRLFNQTEGLDSGFGDDENYNIYDKHLFGGEREHALYKAPSKDDELYGEKDLSMENLLNTSRFKPDRDFEGIDRTVPIEPRSGPVQFEVEKEGEKPQDDEKNQNDDKFFNEDDGEKNQQNNKPEGEGKNEDLYGFEKYMKDSKRMEKNKKEEQRLTLGLMHATGGSGVGGEMSQRTNIDFVKSTREYSRKYRSPSPEKEKTNDKSSPKKSSPKQQSKSPERKRSSPRKSNKRKRSPSPRRNNNSPQRRNRSPPKRSRRSRSPRRR